GYNPLCGDELHLTLRVEDGVIQDIAFQGSGCAISTASASLMTSALKGRRVEEVGELFELFREMVTADRDAPPPAELGKLAVLGGVREFPVRVKCATLAWHTLRAALGGNETSATTE
ncbi:MAG: SUF system NifU family Fe-S cluster assembly protein, partial [Acidobacteriota bacterium]|nr:SUF system NifU family Fe-S cluster assembly protein [Acidobacteriota bacterium]